MDPSEDLKLNRQVCFALYSASRATTQLYRPILESLGLTYPQYLVMLVLWEEQPRTVKDLGAALALDSGTLSPLLKRLEAAGLVRRSRRADDERSVEIHLTDEGAALRERATSVPRKVAAATGFSVGELEALRDQLTTLARTVGEHQLAADELPPKGEPL